MELGPKKPDPRKTTHLPPGSPDDLSPEEEALASPVLTEDQLEKSGVLDNMEPLPDENDL